MFVWASMGDENTVRIGSVNVWGSSEYLCFSKLVSPHSTTHMGVIPFNVICNRGATMLLRLLHALWLVSALEILQRLPGQRAVGSVMSMCLHLVLYIPHFANALCKSMIEAVMLSSASVPLWLCNQHLLHSWASCTPYYIYIATWTVMYTAILCVCIYTIIFSVWSATHCNYVAQWSLVEDVVKSQYTARSTHLESLTQHGASDPHACNLSCKWSMQ